MDEENSEFERAVEEEGVPFDDAALLLVKHGWNLAVKRSRDCLADRALEAWTDTHQKQMQWATCIHIIAAITRMPEAERDRLIDFKD